MNFAIALLSITLCQVLTVASATPQTRSPSIIALPEFTMCVTCRPSTTTALVRDSVAFSTEVLPYPLLIPTPLGDTCWHGDTSGWQHLTWRCSFFHPPFFRRRPLTLPSLPRAQSTLHTRSAVLWRDTRSHWTFEQD